MARVRGPVTLIVPFGSNLDLILRGAIGAVNRFADQVGGGLRAIALAQSTPQDNSAEVQRVLDQIAAEINASSDKVEAAINDQTQGE